MSQQIKLSKCVDINPNNKALFCIQNKCVNCGMCLNKCKQSAGACGFYDIADTKNNHQICIGCGQCILVCPTGALVEKRHWVNSIKDIIDPNKKVVFITAPATRVAFGDAFGLPPGQNVESKLVGACRSVGADYVFDTSTGADLTVMEEASELVHRLMNNGKLPMFTSCCPAWVKFAETFYPEFTDNLSTCKSPIAMMGTLVKTYFAKKENLDPNNIVVISVTPCTAKKFEQDREETWANEVGKNDIDYTITVRELAEWVQAKNITWEMIDNSEFDLFLPKGSGAGIIFGNTGGVTEATLRTAYYLINGVEAPSDFYKLEPVRGLTAIKQAEIDLKVKTINVTVIQGTAIARNFFEHLKVNQDQQIDFIEVMACPGGCIAGGGQPKFPAPRMEAVKQARIQNLYKADEASERRCAHKSSVVIDIYNSFLDKPYSEKSEHYLHTKGFIDRSGDLGNMNVHELNIKASELAQ